MADRPNAPQVAALEWRRVLSQGESGGSQPHVFHCDDGLSYMVKASNNPQDGRVLVNEVVAGLALDWLGVKHPKTAIVDLSEALLDASPSAKFNNGAKLAPGLSFGSELVASDPQGIVPVESLINISDIAGTFVLDTWIQNNDGRQFRIRSNREMNNYEFIPLDQGHSIAPNWNADSLNKMAVEGSVSLAPELLPLTADNIYPFIVRLRGFNQDAAEHIVSQVPVPWLNGNDEKKALTNYLTTRAIYAAEKLHEKYPTT